MEIYNICDSVASPVQNTAQGFCIIIYGSHVTVNAEDDVEEYSALIRTKRGGTRIGSGRRLLHCTMPVQELFN